MQTATDAEKEPDGLEFTSPGQRPGGKVAQQKEALKGRDGPVTAFQAC